MTQPTQTSEQLSNESIIQRLKDIVEARQALAGLYRDQQIEEKAFRLEEEAKQIQQFLDEISNNPELTNVELRHRLSELPRVAFLLDYTDTEWSELEEYDQIK